MAFFGANVILINLSVFNCSEPTAATTSESKDPASAFGQKVNDPTALIVILVIVAVFLILAVVCVILIRRKYKRNARNGQNHDEMFQVRVMRVIKWIVLLQCIGSIAISYVS